jgi:hypothetical protein
MPDPHTQDLQDVVKLGASNKGGNLEMNSLFKFFELQIMSDKLANPPLSNNCIE